MTIATTVADSMALLTICIMMMFCAVNLFTKKIFLNYFISGILIIISSIIGGVFAIINSQTQLILLNGAFIFAGMLILFMLTMAYRKAYPSDS